MLALVEIHLSLCPFFFCLILCLLNYSLIHHAIRTGIKHKIVNLILLKAFIIILTCKNLTG